MTGICGRKHRILGVQHLGLLCLCWFNDNIESAKLRSWLQSDKFAEGVAPEGREGGQILTLLHGKLYVFGGNKGSGYLNDMHIFHLATRTWVDITTYTQGDRPSQRYGHGCAAAQDSLFLFGGRSTAGFPSLPCLNPILLLFW